MYSTDFKSITLSLWDIIHLLPLSVGLMFAFPRRLGIRLPVHNTPLPGITWYYQATWYLVRCLITRFL